MPAFILALPAFIQSLPHLFQLLVKMMALTERFINWSKEKNLNKYLDELEDTIDKLEKAQTSQEKISAGKSLVDLIRKLK